MVAKEAKQTTRRAERISVTNHKRATAGETRRRDEASKAVKAATRHGVSAFNNQTRRTLAATKSGRGGRNYL